LREGDDRFHCRFFDDSESSMVSFSNPFWTYDVVVVRLDSVHELRSGPIRGGDRAGEARLGVERRAMGYDGENS
jgi:hypothetical protein